MRKKDIGIVGAGVAGLHLGLLLQQQNADVTIYTERTAEQVRDGRLPNSVAHFQTTVLREKAMGVDYHWPDDVYMYFCHWHYLGGPQPLFFRGDFANPARAIDYRIYLPALMGDFAARGGHIQVGKLGVEDIKALTEKHDLVVVSTGRGAIAELFPKRADKSPYPQPMRKLAVGLWHGVRRRKPHGVEISLAPTVGELLAIPMYSFEGHVTALLTENVPGGPMEVLATQRYDDDPDGYRKLLLAKLKEHHPTVHERIDPVSFRLQRPQDMLQGAVTPVLREDYVKLDNGRFLLALGDVHAAVDPVVGQGANSASASAQVVADCIAEDAVFDQRFCEKVARRRSIRMESVTDWVNAMVALPPPAHLLKFLGAAAHNRALIDRFTDNFSFPDRQWDMVGTPERVDAAIASVSDYPDPPVTQDAAS